MDELLAVKDRAWEQFRTRAGVHAVGIGKKVTRGVRTDETVLTVFVTKKRPLHELNADALIPAVFEGVRTDVVETPMPQLTDVSISVLPADIPDGKSFTFSTTVDPPPRGTRIIVTLTWHGAGSDETIIVDTDGKGVFDLNGMLTQLRGALDGPFFNAQLAGNTLSITPGSLGGSIDVSCYILLVDGKAYAQEFLRGGILIQAGARDAAGTLGCLATLPADAGHPEGRVVGVTCSHVVRENVTERTLLLADTTGTTTIELKLPSPTAPIHAQTVVSVIFFDRIVQGSCFYTTSEGQSLLVVAQELAAEIGRVGLPGVSAAATLVDPLKARIDVAGFAGAGARLECAVHGPAQFRAVPLQADVSNNPTGEFVVSLSGAVASPNLGVFVDIDNAGFAITFGIYQKPPQNQNLSDLAQAISSAINLWPSVQRGLVSATAVGPKVTISGAKSVRAWVEPDIRVGQPLDFYQQHNAPCCNYRIGRVLDARLDIDVALIELDGGLKYKHHIEEVNAVAGVQTPLPGLAVQKRGAATGLTEGMVSAVATTGFVGAGGLRRVYRNAAIVDSTILEPDGLTHRAFSLKGDSGSAVVTTGPGLPKLVGILFAGNPLGHSIITPVDDVVSGFSHLGLTFDPGIGFDLSAVHTVPAAAMTAHQPESRPLAGFADRMHEVGQQFAATPAGREYAALVRDHFGAALDLVNRNRRVATVWHRSGGPELLNAVLRFLRFDDELLPREINGRPLAESLLRLRKVFYRYASPQLSRALGLLAARMSELSGKTYPQLLATLRTEPGNLDAR